MIGLVIPGRTLLLLLSLFPGMLRRLMMTNDAAGTGTENAVMTGKVASDSPDSRTLEAASRLSGRCGPTGSH
jgi:hypothetical protein